MKNKGWKREKRRSNRRGKEKGQRRLGKARKGRENIVKREIGTRKEGEERKRSWERGENRQGKKCTGRRDGKLERETEGKGGKVVRKGDEARTEGK